MLGMLTAIRLLLLPSSLDDKKARKCVCIWTYICMYVHTHIDIHTYVLFRYQSIHTRNYEFIPISLISIQYHELQSSFLPF